MKVSSLCICFVLHTFFLWAKTIDVCKNCNSTSLKQAVEIAAICDSIFIHKGTYVEEDFIISKSLFIYGEEGTVIDGKNMTGFVFQKVDWFALDGLEIRNIPTDYVKDNAAVRVFQCSNFVISNLRLINNFFGLHIDKSNHGIIRNNIVEGTLKDEASCGNGIHLWHSDKMHIFNNKISHMRDGIYFEFVSSSYIYNNESYHNLRYGLHFMFSNNDEYWNNTFFDNGAGVAVMFSKYIGMHHNLFIKNWGPSSYGLLLKEIYDANIYNNTFKDNSVGINIEGSTRLNYTNNVFTGNGWAVKVLGACYDNAFIANDFKFNSLDVSYSSKLNNNVFKGNYWSDYSGYDLNKDGVGDVPYRPVKLFSYIVNESPEALVLLRSLFIDIINFSEKVSPVFTPNNLTDDTPSIKQINDFS